ncbi:MAG: glycosyltransferase family 2 protein, partial [Candidatus Aenigmarchaeota archaeon]|nr:glycosyltransferase family 2 protein [Candidatus Aenigmarchaeota archaeon]
MNFEAIIMLFIIYFMLYCSLLWILTFYEKRNNVRSDPKPKRYPLVSIIIPAWNEEKNIKNAIISCLALDYPKKEIIVVNDGSTDKTKEICEEFSKKGLIKLINKENGGKASALNAGIEVAKGEYVCCLDADSFFEPKALKQMVGYFEDPKVGAVTSSMKVYKPKNWLQMVQWLEYIFAIYLRKLMSYLNCLYVVPGPGGIYRKDVLERIGGFDENSITEDMEIAFRIQKEGYTIKNSVNAVVQTVVPDKFIPLVKQRIRWYVGFYDNVKKYKSMVFNPKYGSLGMFIIPTAFIWVGVLIFGFFKFLLDVFNSLRIPIKMFMLTGFDPEVILSLLKKSIVFQPNYITV